MAVVYDTAHVLMRIREGRVGWKAFLYPVILSYVDVTYGIVILNRKEVRVSVEEIVNTLRNSKREAAAQLLESMGEFEHLVAREALLALEQLEVIWTVKPRCALASPGRGGIPDYKLVVFECGDVELCREQSRLLSRYGRAVVDVQRYIAPLADLVKEHGYACILVTGDHDFMLAAIDYARSKGITLSTVETLSLRRAVSAFRALHAALTAC
ncbi:MAG: hypothetical protein DRK00_07880 [Thermoprotei archaeon]|nr:MAG: hypothetical protein DRK00_07880 [Thermoprotei archaeon]